MSTIYESDVEVAALGWFEGLGYEIRHGSDIAAGELFQERATYDVRGISGGNTLMICKENFV